MNLITTLNQFKDFNLYFCEPIKNNIMSDGNFIRILYSTNIITLNSIYLLFNITNITCEKYFNKYKVCFNKSSASNDNTLNQIKDIESYILTKFRLKTNKNPEFKISEQLEQNNIKLYNFYSKNNIDLILKISGIWENKTNFGLTYKFYPSVV